MTRTGERRSEAQAVYELTGTLLEACSCGVLCPCWIGEDPDGGECFGLVAYHFTGGQIGGLGVETAEIHHEVVDATGTLRIGGTVEAVMEPYRSFDGTITTLRDSIFSTAPGSPAYVGKTSVHRVELPQYGLVWDNAGRNAIQADYHMVHPG